VFVSSSEADDHHPDHVFHFSTQKNQSSAISLKAPESPKAATTLLALNPFEGFAKAKNLCRYPRSPPPDINPNLVLLRCIVLVI
jgi:hypothetical protein